MTTKKLWTAPDGREYKAKQVFSGALPNPENLLVEFEEYKKEPDLDFSEVDGLIDDMWPSGGNEYDVIRREYKTLIRAIVKLARQK